MTKFAYPTERRVLLLNSYCSNNSKCTDLNPCNRCLRMCNTFNVPREVIDINSIYAGCLGNEEGGI